MKKILNFKQFENLDIYKEEFFDKVQNSMVEILKQRGHKESDKIKKDIIVNFQNKIKGMIDTLTKDGTITPDMVATQIIDKYLEKTKFNEEENPAEGNPITGDRSMNNME